MRRTLHCFVLIPLFLALAGCTSETEAPPTPAAAPDSGPTVAEAMSKFRTGDRAGAAEVLEQVTAREPENSQAWQLLGTVRVALDQGDSALEAFHSALRADPNEYGAMYGAARVHASRGENDAAFDLLYQLKESRAYNLAEITMDDKLKSLSDDERFEGLLMKPEDFADPFVEEARVIREWVGEAERGAFGWIARNIGDVDGDGVADVVTSAPNLNVEGNLAGRVYVYSSATGELLWQHSGEPGDRLGIGIDRAGDVNGDGVPDVVASAPGGGKAFAYSGKDGEVLLELRAAQEGENFGRKVFGVGDVDGDDHSDLLLGSPANDVAGENAGRVALYSGKDGEVLREWQGEAGDRLGASVSGSARDGELFLILGAPDAGEGDRGRVYVYNRLEGEPMFVIESDEAGAELGGMFLSVVGDVDADGTRDIYASDWSHNAHGPTTGRIVVHSGADGRHLLTLTGEAAGDGFGIGPADAGDVDGDGHDDLVIGAWQQSSAAPAGGKVYLYSGKDGSLMRAWSCRVMGDTFGFDATGLGDVDGDGKIDLLLTSAWSAIRGPRTGRVFIVSSGQAAG